MRVLLHLLIFICLTSSTFAQIKKSDLVGDWVKCKAERVDGSRIIDKFETETARMEYNFTHNKFSYLLQTLDYSLIGRKLSINKFSKYIVEKLKNDTLIIAENFPNKRRDKLNRFFFVKKTKPEELEMVDGLVVANKRITNTLLKNINSYLYNSTASKFKYANFKGYMIVNHLDKSVNTFVTESKGTSKGTLKSITKTLNESYDFWKIGKNYDKIRINFFYKIQSFSIFRGTYILFYENAYEDYNSTTKTKPHIGDIQLAEKYFIKGNSNFEKKKYKSAIKNFTKGYNLSRYLLDAVYNRALVHHTMGNLEKACEDWKHLADLGQKDAMKYLEQYCK